MDASRGRRAVLKALAAGAAASTFTPASAEEAAGTPEVRWQLISSFSKSLDLMYGGAEAFAAIVGDLTGGRFHIEVSPPTEAISGLQVLDAVAAGTLDACQTSLDYFYAKDPGFALATAIPFGMNAREQFAFATQGGGDAQLNEILADSNGLAFAAGNTGAQMGGFFKREIKTAGDLAGLKIRIGGLAGRVLQKLGAEPVATPRAEFYSALDSGALDGVTWVSPHDDEKLSADDATRLTKLAPNYYYPGWWRGGSAVHIVVDKRKFDALPAPFQAAVKSGGDARRGRHAGALRYSQPRCSAPSGHRRCAVAAFSAGRARGRLQGHQRYAARNRGREPTIPKAARRAHRLSQRAISVVAGRRIHLR